MTSFGRDASGMFDTRDRKRAPTESIADRVARKEREAQNAGIAFWQPRSIPSIKEPTKEAALRKLIEIVGLPEVPATVVMLAFRPRDVRKEVLSGNALRWMIDGLEERFGGIAERPDPTTDRMREAERVFLGVLAEEYVAGELEVAREESVNTREWAAENL